MTTLKVGKHYFAGRDENDNPGLVGRALIEIWDGDKMVGVIYPADDGVRIVSKHKLAAALDEQAPNALNVTIGRSPQ